MSSSTSLNVTLANAIAYLTRPLIMSYPATTIIKLQLVLEANLTALFASTWVPSEPLRGSGRRCLTLSPEGIPPRAIYSACVATGIQWFDWIALLGNREFDFFVDPGCVSVRYGAKGAPGSQLITVWSDEVSISAPTQAAVEEAKIQAQLKAQVEARARAQNKTFAQQLLEMDKEGDDELFAMIADEISAPVWVSPVVDQFPVSSRTSSPHSRCSSRSSNSSSGVSFGSSDFSGSISSSSLSSSPKSSSQSKSSRNDKTARNSRVFVDASKTQVTPYDGGKTTVLTGGVMLGSAPKKAGKTETSWRN